LRYDLIREIVIGICSLILLGLFYYVFNDFLNTEVKSISLTMRDRFAEVLSWVLVIGAAFAAGRWIRRFFLNPHSLWKTTFLLGESPQTRKILAVFHIFLVLLLIYGSVWKLIDSIFLPLSVFKILNWTWIMMLVSFFASVLKETPDSNKKRDLRIHKSLSAKQAMIWWRLELVLKRNRLTQFCFVLFLLCTVLLTLVAYLSLPFVTVYVLTFWGGFLGACALCFQFAEDLQASYLEKNTGVSHDSYLRVLFSVSLIIGSVLGLIQGVAWVLTNLMFHSVNVDTVLNAVRIFFLSAVPCWIVPAILFQVEGRRALLSILVTFLVGLFVTTAIYASWFALALLPLIAYYGFTSQVGRFYRA
jgi:hypothetical protein